MIECSKLTKIVLGNVTSKYPAENAQLVSDWPDINHADAIQTHYGLLVYRSGVFDLILNNLEFCNPLCSKSKIQFSSSIRDVLKIKNRAAR